MLPVVEKLRGAFELQSLILTDVDLENLLNILTTAWWTAGTVIPMRGPSRARRVNLRRLAAYVSVPRLARRLTCRPRRWRSCDLEVPDAPD